MKIISQIRIDSRDSDLISDVTHEQFAQMFRELDNPDDSSSYFIVCPSWMPILFDSESIDSMRKRDQE